MPELQNGAPKMKYTIDDVKLSETKEIDISPYLNVDEPVKIKIRHLTNKQHNEVIALIMKEQELSTTNKDNFKIKNTDWFAETKKIELLNGIVIDDDFPFEKWDEEFINIIDEKNPELIQYIQEEIQDFNRPLAEQKKEK